MQFSFEFEKEITKELLLSRHSQEKYMEHYTGVQITKSLFRSPLRDDPNPTCSYYKNSSGDLILHDFRGDFHGNFISVVMYKFNCSFYRALRIIANDFGIVKINNLKLNAPKIEYSGKVMEQNKQCNIQIEAQNFSEKELAWWASFGISQETLKKYRVYSCKNVFLNCNFFSSSSDYNPTYGYYGGKKNGIEYWRIYMPVKRSYRFISNWTKMMIQGANGLPESGEFVVVTKSLKDVMLLSEFGIPAIAPNSESTFLSDIQLSKLKERFSRVIVFYDNDIAGLKSMNKIRKKHDVECIWLPRNKAKDITDFFKKFGKNKTLELINYGKEKLKLC